MVLFYGFCLKILLLELKDLVEQFTNEGKRTSKVLITRSTFHLLLFESMRTTKNDNQ
jgi:hypothetical protein